MQQKRSYVGPRGWAMLVLIGGEASASPFLRPPQIEMDANISESPLARKLRPAAQLATVGFSRDMVQDANRTVAPESSSEADRSGSFAAPDCRLGQRSLRDSTI